MRPLQITRLTMLMLAAWLLAGAGSVSAVQCGEDPGGDQGEDSGKEPEPSNPARENDDLREFFLAQYYDLSRVEIRFLRRNPPAPGRSHRKYQPNRFVDRFIDKRIDHFVGKIEKTIAEGEEALTEIRDISDELGADFSQFKNLRGRWRKAFDKLAKKSDDLHDRMAMVFLELDGGADLKIESGPEDREEGYAGLVETLALNFRKGVEGVRGLFIEPTHTVHISDLQNKEGVLAHLQRAKILSEHMRQELKR